MKNNLILVDDVIKEKITYLKSILDKICLDYILYSCDVELKNKMSVDKFKADISILRLKNNITKIYILDNKIIGYLSKIANCSIWNKTKKKNLNKHIGNLSDTPIYRLQSPDALYKNPVYINDFLNFFKAKREVVITDYKEMKFNQPVCVDIETTGLDHTKDKILSVAIGTKEGVRSFSWSPRVADMMQDICHQTSCFVAHSANFDLSFLMKEGCKLPRKVFDTLVASKFYKTNLRSYNMEDLCFDLLGLNYHTETIDKSDLSNENVKRILEFNAKDVQKEIELARFLGKEVILGNPKVRTIFDYYMNAVRMFTLVGNKPVLFDKDLMQAEKIELEIKINQLEKEIKSEIKIDNLNSSKQLGEVLFNQYNLPVINYTKTGAKSTDAKSLQEINYLKPTKVLSKIIEYRKAQSNLSKFYNKYSSEIYSIYKTYGAETGRTSCTSTNNENLQQLPPDMLFRWLQNGYSKFDYSQIELKAGAFVSGENHLLGLFKQGKDIHDYTLNKIKKELDNANVAPEYQRRVAKTLNFGAFYGGGGKALHDTLMKEGIYIPIQDCYKFTYALNRIFPNQDNYRNKVEMELIEKGYVDILTGRKADYYIYGLNMDDYKRKKIIKEAANAKIQGLASGDISLCSVVDLWLDCDLLPLIYRHDEAVYGVPYEELIQYKDKLEHPKILDLCGIDLGIPLTVDFTDLIKKEK